MMSVTTSMPDRSTAGRPVVPGFSRQTAPGIAAITLERISACTELAYRAHQECGWRRGPRRCPVDALQDQTTKRCGRHVGRLTSMAFSWRRVASEERAATSVRRVGGEATLRARLHGAVSECKEFGARSVASAVARFAGRGPFLTLRRCEGDREGSDD